MIPLDPSGPFWSYVQQQTDRFARLKACVDRIKAGKNLGSDDDLWLKQRMALDSDTMAERLVTKADLAQIFQRTKRQIQTYADQGMPKKDDLYPFAACVQWWITQQTVEDADMAGPVSPALEQYRQEKAREAKRKNDVAEGLLVDSAEIGSQLGEIGRVFREESSAIERIHGAAVGDLIRGAVDRAETSWRAAVVVPEPVVEGEADGEA